jgi:hypothetical protein
MKQVAMHSALDHSVLDHDGDRPTDPRQYPMTDLVRTYLQQTGSKFLRIGTARREQAAATRAQDLWDYLGDFA